jgi:hypothetical protein
MVRIEVEILSSLDGFSVDFGPEHQESELHN